MQRDLDPQILREVISIIGAHPDLNLRLMQGLVELELRGLPRVAVEVLHVGSQERWLLQIQLLKRGSYASELRLSNRGLIIGEELVGAVG